MNIYIKDADTKHCYASVRNVDEGLRNIIHTLLCHTGCIEICISDFWKSSAYTIYVNPVRVDMSDYIRNVVADARRMLKRLRSKVK